MTLKYPISIITYVAKDRIMECLNSMPNISAEYVQKSLGDGYIAINIEQDEVSADDIFSIGTYIGQLETMTLMGS